MAEAGNQHQHQQREADEEQCAADAPPQTSRRQRESDAGPAHSPPLRTAAAARETRTASRARDRRSTSRPKSPSRARAAAVPSAHETSTGSTMSRAARAHRNARTARSPTFMARARAPRRRTPPRDACSRGTCRDSRRRARAALCRRPARVCSGELHRLLEHRCGAFDCAHRLRQRCASAGASRPMSTDVADLAAKRCGERREILVLAIAARDHDQGSRHAADGGERRADVRALRIVDPAHAATSATHCMRCGSPVNAAQHCECGLEPRSPAASPAPAPRARWRRCAGP